MSIFKNEVGESIALATHLMVQTIEIDVGSPIRLEKYEIRAGSKRRFRHHEQRVVEFHNVCYRCDKFVGLSIGSTFKIALRKDLREGAFGWWEPCPFSDGGEFSALLDSEGVWVAAWSEYSYEKIRSPVTLRQVVGTYPHLHWVGDEMSGTSYEDRKCQKIDLKRWRRVS